MKTVYYLLVVCSAFFFSACQEDEKEAREHVRIKTTKVTNISDLGASFTADIFSGDINEIVEYGFFWSENPDISSWQIERVVQKGPPSNSNISIFISSRLKPNTVYYVLAFVVTNEYTVTGGEQSFLSFGSEGPQIEAIDKLYGTLGDTVNIIGNGFSYVNNTVRFNDVYSFVVSSTDTLIKAIVPDVLKAEKSVVNVFTEDYALQYKDSFQLKRPKILGVSSDIVKSYENMYVYGEYFGNSPYHVRLFLGEKRIMEILYDSNKVFFEVPEGLDSQTYLSVVVAEQRDSILLNYLKPMFREQNIESVTWNETVLLEVENFYEDKSKVQLYLNDAEINHQYINDTLISINIPESIDVSLIEVKAIVAGSEILLNDQLEMKLPRITDFSLDTLFYEAEVQLSLQNIHPSTNIIKIGDLSIELDSPSDQVFKFSIPVDDRLYAAIDENNRVPMVLNCGGLKIDTLITLKNPTIEEVFMAQEFKLKDTITIRGSDLSNMPKLNLFVTARVENYRAIYINVGKISLISISDEEAIFSYEIEKFDIVNTDCEIVFEISVDAYKNKSNTIRFTQAFEGPWVFKENYSSLFRNYSRNNPHFFSDGDNGYAFGDIKRNDESISRDFYGINLIDYSLSQLSRWQIDLDMTDYSTYYPSYDPLLFVHINNNYIYVMSSSGYFYEYEILSDSWSLASYFQNASKYHESTLIGDKLYLFNWEEGGVEYENTVLSYNIKTADSVRFKTPFHVYDIPNLFQINGTTIIYTFSETGGYYDIYELNTISESFELLNTGEIPRSLSLDNRLIGYAFDRNGIYRFNHLTLESEFLIDFPITVSEVNFLFQRGNKISFSLNNQYVVEIDLDLLNK